MTSKTIAIGLSVCLVLAPRLARGQSATDLAKQTQNPVSSLVSVPIQGNWDSGLGARNTTGTVLNVQPVMPFGLTKDWNVILRVVMPILSQPAAGGLKVNGVGDTLTTMFLSPAGPRKTIWGAGPAVLLPTATSNALGSEKIGLGPSVVGLAQPGRFTVGMLFNQVWSVSGASDRADVSQMLLQPFVNYNLGGGLAIGAVSEATANWEKEEDKWSVPLMFTVSKIARLGRQPVNFQGAAGPYLDDRENGPEWRLRVAVTFLFPR